MDRLSPAARHRLQGRGAAAGRRLAVALALGAATASSVLPAAAQAVSRANARTGFATLWVDGREYGERELVALARDPDPLKRQYAALRLAELDPPSETAMAALAGALKDPAADVRHQALAGLMRLGAPATAVLAASLSDFQVVQKRDPWVSPVFFEPRQRRAPEVLHVSDMALAALSHADSVDVAALLDAYLHGPVQVSDSARGLARARILTLLERRASAVTPELLRALAGEDTALTLTATRVIGRSRDAAAAVPLLVRLTKHESTSVRQAAANALAQIREGGPEALRELLSHPEASVRATVVAAYPASADSAATAVARTLRDPEPGVRKAALDRIRAPNGIDWFRERSPSTSPLLAELPASVLSSLLELRSDSSAAVRAAAAGALGSFRHARAELGAALPDTIATMLSDPEDRVRSAAAKNLAALAWRHRVPGGEEIRSRVLDALVAPGGPETRRELLQVLGRMDLPEAERGRMVGALVAVCTDDGIACYQASTILGSRPGWRDDALAVLESRIAALVEPDSAAFEALGVLGLGNPGYTRVLERLLGHAQKRLRVRAAVLLARRGVTPPRVREVLNEAVLEHEAAAALVNLDEAGVERVAVVVEDRTTPIESRDKLLYTLFRAAARSKRAADLLLAAVAGSIGPRSQSTAIGELWRVNGREEDVQAALWAAFAADDAMVRRAAVAAWAVRRFPPGELIGRVLADSTPEVRAEVFLLLEGLPLGDPQRVVTTKLALEDPEQRVRDRALEFAATLGREGADLLAGYVEAGKPLTRSFFGSARAFSAPSPRLGRAMEARSRSADAEERERIEEALSTGVQTPVESTVLRTRLESANANERARAARELLARSEDPWARGGRLAAVLMDTRVREIVMDRLHGDMGDRYRVGYLFSAPFFSQLSAPSLSRSFDGGAILMSREISNISREISNISRDTRYMSRETSNLQDPPFPWPPPPGYSRVAVPRQLFVSRGSTTLGDVYRAIIGALEGASTGFDHGLFVGVPGGFVVVARMERVRPDGTPLPGRARWMKEGTPHLTLAEFLGDLFFEKPGYFRVIAFAVTNDLTPGSDPRARLPDPGKGAPTIPDGLEGQPFESQEVIALIYSFERHRNARIKPWTNGAPSAREHLTRSGVWARLGRP